VAEHGHEGDWEIDRVPTERPALIEARDPEIDDEERER
jgi:hypothetical protein